MKAVVYTRYGPPDVLQISEVEKPVPNDDQVLVKIQAVSLNPADWHLRRGELLARPGTGLLRPKDTISGADFAGQVEAVGKNIIEYKPGDEVFGRRAPNGFAEYVCVSVKPIALKPANITFEQAAAVPIAGLTALQSLRDAGRLQPGQKVLVNGASGGVGTFAVQIAKALGADVTGVCSARNAAMVRWLGADRVMDYKREDFTRSSEIFDLIVDNIGNHSIGGYLRALSSKGRCVIVGFSSLGLLFQHIALGQVVSAFGGRKIGTMMSRIKTDDLYALKDMIEAGKVTPYVDKVYPLSDTAAAFRYLEEGHARGKVIVTME